MRRVMHRGASLFWLAVLFPLFIGLRAYARRLKRDAKGGEDTILVDARITGIGNAILFTPVITNLQAAFPLTKIDLVCIDNAAVSVFRGLTDVDNVHAVPPHWWRSWLRLYWRLKGRRYRMAFTVAPDWGFALLSLLAGTHTRVGHHYPRRRYLWGYDKTFSALLTHLVPIQPDRHEVEYNLDLLRAAGVAIASDAVNFSVPEEYLRRARDYLHGAGTSGRLIGMHPGSSTRQTWKRWPAEKYAELCRLLASSGWCVLLLGGPEEQELAGRVEALARGSDRAVAGRIVNAAGATDLLHTAGLIKQVDVVVGNDSGLVHIAAALGVPVAVLYGPTDHVRTAPRGARALQLHAGLECGRCYRLDPEAPDKCVRSRRCLQQLSVEMVERAIHQLSSSR